MHSIHQVHKHESTVGNFAIEGCTLKNVGCIL